MIEALTIKPSRILGMLSFLLAVFVLSPAMAGAEPVVVTDVTVQVEGKPLHQTVPPIIVDGRLLIGVRAVGEAVGGTVDWNPETRQVTVTRRTDKVVLTIGGNEAVVNGKAASLEVPPLIFENRTMVPLRFIAEALGGSVHWDGATRTANILRKPAEVTQVTYLNTPAKGMIKVTLSEPLISISPQTEGNTLALNLYPAAIATPKPAQNVGDGLVNQIGLTEGWRQVRLAIGLVHAPSYRYHVSPDGLELTIELDHTVTAAGFRQEGRIALVSIGATGKLAYKTLKLTNPDRLVVDISGARLTPGTPPTVAVGKGFISQIRMAQFQKDVVRVVIDMTDDPPAQVVATGRGLEVRFVPQITAVKTEKLQGKTRLTLVGTLPMDATVVAVPEKKQIVITVPQGISGLKDSTVKVADGTINTVAVATGANGTSSLITVQLPYYLGHTVLSKNGDANIALELVTSPVYGRRIWVDAGHGKVPGGKDDPGSIGKVYRVYEKHANLQVSLELQKLLQAAGAQVFMTRTGDEGIDFTQRPALVNATRPPVDLFVSVHHNSAASPTARGVETYYWTTNPKSRRAAELIHPAVIKALGFPDRRVRSEAFYVIKEVLSPSVLIELGYLSNAEEEKAIAAPGYALKAAEGIKNGIFQFFWKEIQAQTAN
ncbi:MAG: N-acetylmuramoyl-L-alanine amidase [Bacillota bacterium]